MRAIQPHAVDAVGLVYPAVVCPVQALVGQVVVEGEGVVDVGQGEGGDDVVVGIPQVDAPDLLLLGKQQEGAVDWRQNVLLYCNRSFIM